MTALGTTTLGNTGITVTRLSAGGHFTNGPTGHEDVARRVEELHHHLDSGITYFDVQWDLEEVATAEVMKSRKNEMTVAWPLHGVTQLGADLTAKYIVEYCNDHRVRYGIEHVDILLWIALEVYEESQERVMEEIRKAVGTLKTDGFFDHFGFSCHHSPEMAAHAIEHFDDFEVMMVPYAPIIPAVGRAVLELARSKGVGTVGMKPFGGGIGALNKIYAGEAGREDLAKWKGSGRPYQAAIRWVLQEKNLDCTVPGMHSIQEIDEIVSAAGEPFNEEDQTILYEIEKAVDTEEMQGRLADFR